MTIRNRDGQKAAVGARRLLSSASVAVLALAGAVALPGVAAANDWTGAVSTDWFTAGNWANLAAVPTVNANADINTTAPNTTVIDGAAAIANDVRVGVTGTGNLVIQNGGTLNNFLGYIGYAAGSSGTVIVNGVGAAWTNDSTLYVGYEGAGALYIYNGAKVTDITGILAFAAGSVDYGQIDGAGSTWQNNASLTVGMGGQAQLKVLNGGAARAGSTTVGANTGSVGALLVDGATSSVNNTDALIVGDNGTGTATFLAGGKAANTTGVVAQGLDSVGTVSITGAGSSWINSAALTIGGFGTATVTVADGGKLQASQGYVAYGAGHSASVTVDGAGSVWQNNGAMAIGWSGAGALTISDGGVVIDSTGVLAYNAGSTGVAIITGSGSTWNSASNLLLGYGGAGTLTVTDRGIAKAGASILISGLAGSSGTLNIGAAAGSAAQAAGTLDTASVAIGASGVLNFNHTETNYVFVPQMGGAGLINQLAGVTVLTANSSGFTGATDISGGQLLVDGALGGTTSVLSGGALGGSGTLSGPVSIAAGGRLLGETGQTLVMGSLVLDGGSSVNVNLGAPGGAGLFNVGGDLTLGGTLNTSDAGGFGMGVYRLFNYGGALTDNGLTVGVLPVGTTGVVQTSVAAQVNLVVNGALVPGGPPTIQFWNGVTTVANGAINGGDGVWNASPQTNWTDAAGAQVDAWGGNFAVFQAPTGAVTVDGSSGSVYTTGMQFIGQGWTVNGDAITLNGAGGATTIRVGDGTLAGASDTATIGSELTGATILVKDDLGTLTLTGTNTYTGGTTVAAGTLIGRAGSFGAGAITDDGTLIVDQATNASFTNLLGGNGVFVKTGAGVLTMNTVNSFSGATTVAAGQLTVNGSLMDSAVTVRTGAILAGAGSVGGVALQSGGAVSPGIAAIGTLSVYGDVTQASGSTYALDLASTGQADRITASGAATLAVGAILKITKIDAAPYVLGTRYTVLQAVGGVTGRYTLSGATQLSNFIGLVDRYDATHVYVDVDRTKTFAAAGETANQIATGEGADSLSTINPLFTTIVWLPTDTAARDAFDQLSGEIHPSIQGRTLEDSRFVREAAIDRLRDGFGADEPLAVWGRAFGAWGEADGDGNAAGFDRDIGGFLMGVDAEVSGMARVGLFGGYSHSTFEVGDRDSSGEGDSYHVGGYAGMRLGRLSLRSGVAYAWHDVSTDRSVAFAGFSDTLESGYRADTGQVFGEIAWRVDADKTLAFEPFADLAYVTLSTKGFTERGGAAALTAQSEEASVTYATVGLRASSAFELANGASLSARGLLGWRVADGDTTPTTGLSFSGGSRFTVAGVPVADETAVVEAGLDLALSPTAHLGVSYSGQFGDQATDQSVRASFAVRF